MPLPMRLRLRHELIEDDKRQAKRERVPNIYRIGHYLKALDDCEAGADSLTMNGHSELRAWSEAFADTFMPTRDMHRIARKLGLLLDVERGQWIVRDEDSAHV